MLENAGIPRKALLLSVGSLTDGNLSNVFSHMPNETQKPNEPRVLKEVILDPEGKRYLAVQMQKGEDAPYVVVPGSIVRYKTTPRGGDGTPVSVVNPIGRTQGLYADTSEERSSVEALCEKAGLEGNVLFWT